MSKHYPIGPLDYTRRLWLRLTVVGALLFLYVPLFVMMAFSFNDSNRTIRWEGFTTDWYVRAMANDSLREAFLNSLVIALSTTVLATAIGTGLAICLWRFRFPGKTMLEAVNGLPIVIPEISLGVAMMIFFKQISWPSDLAWPLNLIPIIIAHVAFAFPFVTLVVRARLSGFDRSLEEAAFDLGANIGQFLRDVLLPYLKPALIAGSLLAFTLSLDDFVITYFVSEVGSTTLPVKVYSQLRFSVKPEINAAFTVLIVLTASIAIAAAFILNSMQKKNKS
jgi:spermidine/putrescine transport system permease protein